ncbi:DUF3035 domain-containing protein [Aliiroseovarius sp. KMU-50]|uniref:DUF3035 domain-containing protein n=1 Tax=Aliiroseovarius salicola TaxID=3009082 RepID=A0ABT4VWV9_9RHOB|nr:DUF3035 domain-containing protein [Aliiroseovarius sp. KMU-50]MDA5092722.1 DUF3035 domain-containing protein [Aliiroseovarius sp. KMU-50]
MKSVLILCFAALGLSACSEGEPRLMNFKASTTTPDEFAILPTKPLQEPESYSALPAPTPGGSNVTDPTPLKDAVAVLGGKPSLLDDTGIRRGESGLVSYATRKGVSGNIRQVLAAEDLQFRTDNNGRLLERLFNVNTYFSAYELQELDQHRELERLRLLGVWTPSAPPEITK